MVYAALSLNYSEFTEFEFGPNQSVSKASGIDSQRLHVTRHLFTVSAEYDLKDSLAGVLRRAVNNYDEMWSPGHGKGIRCRSAEMNPTEIYMSRTTR
ncbi:MAG: hypothetical protein CL467_09425 [Acidimicrobiaceae bacterium]|nr:hypothetical protein [Acidimicrobiaceae bacterium]